MIDNPVPQAVPAALTDLPACITVPPGTDVPDGWPVLPDGSPCLGIVIAPVLPVTVTTKVED